MKRSDRNHLRRLLGWVRCDIGQSPAELQQTMIDVADGLGHPDISPEAKTRMVESYRRAESIPLCVRAAVKALEKTLAAGGRGESDASAAAEPLQNHPNAAANGVACRDTPAEPPTLRRYIQAPPPASAPDDAKVVAWMDPETLDVISAERKASWLAEYGAGGAAKAASYTRALGDLRPAAGDARCVIQAAVNSIARPKGLTDKQWEFVKAGAHLVVFRVNSMAAQTAQGEG